MEVELFDQIRCNKFLSTKVITHLVCAKMWPRHSTQGPNWFNRTIYTGSFDNSQYLCRLDTMYFQAVLTAINKRITWSSMALNRTRWRKTWPWLVESKKIVGVLKKSFSGTWFLSGHLGDSDKNAAERASKNIARHFLFQGGHVMSSTCRRDFFFASPVFPKLQPVGKLLWQGLKLNIGGRRKTFKARWHESPMPQKMQRGLDQ